jgi:hypothetical protein
VHTAVPFVNKSACLSILEEVVLHSLVFEVALHKYAAVEVISEAELTFRIPIRTRECDCDCLFKEDYQARASDL